MRMCKLFYFLCLFFTCQVTGANTTTNIDATKIAIENDYIRRTLSCNNKHVSPDALYNKSIDVSTILTGQEFIIVLCSGDTIKSDGLELEKISSEEFTKGRGIVISFQPYTCGDVEWFFTMNMFLGDDDFFLRKNLSIRTQGNLAKEVKIDYIDMDCFDFSEINLSTLWSRPDMENIRQMKGYYLALGQPVYANSCFFGSEFPETDNRVVNGKFISRYYCGKNLRELGYAGKLNQNHEFVTWNNVEGVSGSLYDMKVIRNDFLRYIEKISKPSKLRVQYNSWYDWYMTISSEKLLDSFVKMEEGFTKAGLRPIDSYVLDNGWNAYANISDENSTPNRGDFWEFNDKFPNGLDECKRFADNSCSTLGLWMSPRGGGV